MAILLYVAEERNRFIVPLLRSNFATLCEKLFFIVVSVQGEVILRPSLSPSGAVLSHSRLFLPQEAREIR